MTDAPTPDRDELLTAALVALHGLLTAPDGEVRRRLAQDAAAHGETTTAQTYARLAAVQARALLDEVGRG